MSDKKRPWLPADDEKLLTLRKAGVRIEDICLVLERGRRSIEIRLDRLKSRGVETYGQTRTVTDPRDTGCTKVTASGAADGSARLLDAILRYYERRVAA